MEEIQSIGWYHWWTAEQVSEINRIEHRSMVIYEEKNTIIKNRTMKFQTAIKTLKAWISEANCFSVSFTVEAGDPSVDVDGTILKFKTATEFNNKVNPITKSLKERRVIFQVLFCKEEKCDVIEASSSSNRVTGFWVHQKWCKQPSDRLGRCSETEWPATFVSCDKYCTCSPSQKPMNRISNLTLFKKALDQHHSTVCSELDPWIHHLVEAPFTQTMACVATWKLNTFI